MSRLNASRCLLFPLVLLASTARSAEDLNCLTAEERTAARLYTKLQEEAYAADAKRLEKYEQAIRSADDLKAYQQRLKEFFIKQLGGPPPQGPLNEKTVGKLEGEGFTIENVIFESQSRHHVTANLYLPSGKGPFPGVIVASGHSRPGKAADYNQRFGLAMVKHGIAALVYDPIGQGERSQILTKEGKPQFNSTTTEHYLVGVGSILVGRNTASYRAWDAMRCFDYLASRPEIDATKLGMTGCSGGGTMTSYVMALDDRVACAAPACYLTTMKRLIETLGPQDAEQNVFGQIAFGLDHPDYILLRAPKPTLISATTQDFFDIRGTWDNFRQAKRAYGRLGHPEQVELVEVEGKHGVQPQNLAAITVWMQRWLLGSDQPVNVANLPVRPEKELQCTEQGQVLLMTGEHSVFDLNAEYERILFQQRANAWTKEMQDTMRNRVREVAGIRPLDQLAAPKFKDLGRVQRDGYHIDKLTLTTDSGIPLPALTFHPPAPHDEAYLYLHEDGKLGDSAIGGAIESLVSDGYAVVSVDLRGQGETGGGKRDALLGDARTFYLSYLLGKSLTGSRAEDALAAGHWVAYYQKPKDKPRKVHLVGVGQAGIVALHAAAMRPDLFASVTLKNAPRDWASAVKQAVPAGALDHTIHGALAVYDLPDLATLIGADKVKFEK